jgi:tetratricopeptide (TPR) repeat protein
LNPARSWNDPPPAEIAKAIRDLGAPSYVDREKASRRLWSIGPGVEPALREALKSPDAEVVARARDLLDKIPYGITPDSPRRFVELIATARAGGFESWKEVVPHLLDLGPTGLELAEKLADRLGSDERDRTSRRKLLDGEVWRITPNLIARGDEGRVEELLERGARAGAADPDPKPVRHYASWLALKGKLGTAMPIWRERAANDDAAAVITYQLARLAGDHALARAMADKTGRDELREAALFDAGAWADLAGLPPPGVSSHPATLFGLRLLYQQLAGHPGEATLEELKKLPLESSGPYIPPRVFRALMFAHRTEEAAAVIAANTLPDTQLLKFELLCQKNRYDEAFATLKTAIPDHSTQRWQWDAARLRVHYQLGEMDKYRELLSQLPSALANSVEVTGAQDLVEQLVGIGRTADALPTAAAALAYGGTPAVVFEKLYPKTTLAAEAWWHILRMQHPADAPRELVDRLPALLDKRLATPDGRATLKAAIATAREVGGSEGDRWLQGLAEACQSGGLEEEARTLMQDGAKRLDTVGAWLKLGDLLADQRRFAEAAVAFESAWKKDERQPLAIWLTGWAKERAGNAVGRDIRERAHGVTLGDDEARVNFADELAKRAAYGPEIGDSVRRERKLAIALGTPASNKGRNVHGTISSDPLARTDRLEAAGDAQRFLIRMLRTNAYFKKHESYLLVLHRMEANRARGLLAKGEIDGALQAADAAQALLPGATSPAEYIVLDLAKRGRTTDADRIYRAAADVLDKLCAEYPQSAEFRSKRAWLAARCRRDLPAAKELAQKAVALVPTAAGYHDTLAEVCFQSGDRAGALAAIQKALELEPKSRAYAQQKARYEAGDVNAPLPEGR